MRPFHCIVGQDDMCFSSFLSIVRSWTQGYDFTMPFVIPNTRTHVCLVLLNLWQPSEPCAKQEHMGDDLHQARIHGRVEGPLLAHMKRVDCY